MSQAIARRNLNPASLRQTGGARTVLLRMAADDARAERIRQLKDDHPGVTWASIAEAVGVKERSAVEWARTGGIGYENAKKLAAHFDCDLDWLWRGKEPAELPVPLGNSDASQLDRIEAKLDALYDALLGGATQPDALERLQAAFETLRPAAEAAPRPAARKARRAQN